MLPTAPDPLPDDALVVRGGRNSPEQVEKAFATHPGGVTGVAVESAAGLTVAQLAAIVPADRVGVTTVGRVRGAGGDVVRTAGHGPNQAAITGLSAEQISRLLTPSEPNPAKRPS